MARVVLEGKLESGVTGKDVIVTLCGLFNQDEVLNHAIEFAGLGVGHLSIDERLTIANMTTEWGALVGLFPIDEKTLDWVRQRIDFVEKRDHDEHPRLTRQRLRGAGEKHSRGRSGCSLRKDTHSRPHHRASSRSGSESRQGHDERQRARGEGGQGQQGLSRVLCQQPRRRSRRGGGCGPRKKSRERAWSSI